jgi:hypothetical protein
VRRSTAFAVAAALFLLATAPALASPNPESGLRHRLVAAVQRTLAAKSLVGRATSELHEPGRRPFPFYRLEERIEDTGVMKTDSRRFPPGRWTRHPTNELLTVGDRGWYRANSDRYREATLGPGIALGFEGEFTDLERAVSVSKDLKTLGGDRYELTTPSSTFNGPEGGAEPSRLIISLSAAGHLRRLKRIDQAGPQLVIIAETFTDFGYSLGIAPPPADAIETGPVKEVTNQSEFGELLGPLPFGND